jgi:ERCC4-type nuclease
VIYLTDAPNDKDLIPIFGKMAHVAPIKYGDFEFDGLWEGRRHIRIVGDRKHVGDLVSSVNNGRHMQQVLNAREAGFHTIFLITEGLFRAGTTGLLEVFQGGNWKDYYPFIEYARVDAYLNQLQHYMNVQVKRSSSRSETVKQVIDLYLMFQKPPEDHSSLKIIYSIAPPSVYLFGKPSLIQRVAKEFKGVGWERTRAIKDYFASVREMVNAIEDDWMKIDGVGKGIAKSIVKEINETHGQQHGQ